METPSGNAWVIALPKGSRIETEQGKLIPAVNEIQDGLVVGDVAIVSQSYLIERDERELELLRIIEELKIRKDVP